MPSLSLKILLVEDNAADVLLLEEALREVPSVEFKVTAVARLAAALHCLNGEVFDAVLLDLDLPDSQGLETLGTLQTRHPSVPILILTGLHDADFAVKAVRAGAQDYLVKGATTGVMIALTIRYAIERQRIIAALDNRASFQRALLENFPNGSVSVFDREMRYVLAAGRGLTQTGFSPETLMGKRLEEIFTAEEAAWLTSQYSRVLDGETVEFELANAGRFSSLCAAPLPDRSGTISHVLAVSQDITARKSAEEERDRFFTLSPAMLCIAGPDGSFRRLNPAFSHTLGCSEAELLAKPFVDFIHPDDRAVARAAFRTSAEGGTPADFETRCLRKDGAWRWLEWNISRVAEGGAIYAAARDMTERKELVAKLLRLRDELEVHVAERTAELAQAIADLHVQIHEREDAEAETRARARQQEAVAELGRRALIETDMDGLFQGATDLMVATLGVDLSTLLELSADGAVLRIRAGSGWNVDTSQMVVPVNDSSQAGYCLHSDAPVIVPDLRTETRFEPSQALLSLGAVSAVTVVVSGHGRPFGTLGVITFERRAFTRDDVNFLRSLANVLSGVIERNRNETAVRQLNSQLEAFNESLRTENTARQTALASLSEVSVGLKTAKEEAERAMQDAEVARKGAEVANLAKSEFLSRMSHELRTPLNAILGFGQILENQDLDLFAKESVNYILKGGRHLLELINEVLDVARVEAGNMEFSVEPVSLGDIVPEVCALMRHLAADRQIRMNGAAFDTCNVYVLADRQRLKQVLINLLANAIKYNREGGLVELTLKGTPAG